MNESSEKMDLIKKCEDLLRAKLKIERGDRCEVCGRTNKIGLFHILTKEECPRLRLHSYNILLTCWMPCHYYYHQNKDDFRAQRTIAKIKELIGEDYKKKLKALHFIQPKVTMFQLHLTHAALKQELEELER